MSRRLRADLALPFCTLLWGSTFVVKNSLHSSVFEFFGARFTLAGVGTALFRPGILRALQREEIFAGVRLGFCYRALRFLAEDVGKCLDQVLDAILRALAHQNTRI